MEINNLPNNIITNIFYFLSHPITEIYNNDCYYIINQIKHINELQFYKIYFYFLKYPILLNYLKSDTTKQIYDVL
jgi:hypothetical protein